MSGDFSREAFAQILGPEVMALAEAEAAAAPPPSPAVVERVRKIFAPSVGRLAVRQQHEMTNAARSASSQKARAA